MIRKKTCPVIGKWPTVSLFSACPIKFYSLLNLCFVCAENLLFTLVSKHFSCDQYTGKSVVPVGCIWGFAIFPKKPESQPMTQFLSHTTFCNGDNSEVNIFLIFPVWTGQKLSVFSLCLDYMTCLAFSLIVLLSNQLHKQ